MRKYSITILCIAIMPFYSTYMMAQQITPQSKAVNNVDKSIKPVINSTTQTNTNTQQTNTSNTQQSEMPASSRIQDGREPAELIGYVSWVDPSNQKKHLVRGQERTTGQWKILNYGAEIRVDFKNVRTNEIFWVTFTGGSYYTAVDSNGNSLGNNPSNWNETNPPVALKYRIIFSFDLNYTGNPIISDASTYGVTNDQTVRYNPEVWKFYDIKATAYIDNPRSSYDVPMEDFPERPVILKKRTSSFTGLPNLQ